MTQTFGKDYFTGTVFWKGAADLLAEAVLMALQEKDILVAISLTNRRGNKVPDMELALYQGVRMHLSESSEYAIETELKSAMASIRTARSHEPPRMPTDTTISRHHKWDKKIPSAHEQIAFPEKLKEVKVDPLLVERIRPLIVRA